MALKPEGWSVRLGRGLAELPLRSWRHTAIAAVLLVALFGIALALLLPSGPLRHANLPGHPYPPAGYVQNPFSTNPDDLLSKADVARVTADFNQDGQLELSAFANGDSTILDRADAGGHLQVLRQNIAQNNSEGIVQLYDNHRQSLEVGRHPGPSGPSITWFAEEKGTSKLTSVLKANRKMVQTQSFRFDAQFWLTEASAHYVITDAYITNSPMTGG